MSNMFETKWGEKETKLGIAELYALFLFILMLVMCMISLL